MVHISESALAPKVIAPDAQGIGNAADKGLQTAIACHETFCTIVKASGNAWHAVAAHLSPSNVSARRLHQLPGTQLVIDKQSVCNNGGSAGSIVCSISNSDR